MNQFRADHIKFHAVGHGCLDTSRARTMQSILSILSKALHFSFESKAADSPLKRPPSVSWILEHRTELKDQPASTIGRTPLATLYRIYEYFIADYTAGVRTEVEFFFNQPSWAVAEIPDPQDPDPERYVVLAVLPSYLVHAFNRLIERGLPRGSPAIIMGDAAEAELRDKPRVLETEPEWAANVPKLGKVLVIPDAEGHEPAEDARSEKFMAMNIIAEAPYVVFV